MGVRMGEFNGIRIEVPDHLAAEFIAFLDVAQSSITGEDIASFSPQESEVLKIVDEFLDKHLDGGAARRYPTHRAKELAAIELATILGLPAS